MKADTGKIYGHTRLRVWSNPITQFFMGGVNIHCSKVSNSYQEILRPPHPFGPSLVVLYSLKEICKLLGKAVRGVYPVLLSAPIQTTETLVKKEMYHGSDHN